MSCRSLAYAYINNEVRANRLHLKLLGEEGDLNILAYPRALAQKRVNARTTQGAGHRDAHVHLAEALAPEILSIEPSVFCTRCQ